MWIMQIELTYKGDSVDGHSHQFDHQHLLSLGEVDVTVDDKTTRFTAPSIIFIAKGKEHSMKAVSDYTLGYCIHPIRDGKRVQDIIDPTKVPSYANAEDFPGDAMFLTDEYKKSFDKGFTQ